MKFLLTAGLLFLASTVPAQDRPGPGPAFQAPAPCAVTTLRALRGTYALTGSAWQDLSEINPALPKGYAPVTILGAFKLEGNGTVSGWAMVNAGGLQMTTEFVNSQFGAPGQDCSIPISLSMRIKEFGGAITGPYSYVGVVSGDRSAPDIAFMMLGTGPGSHLELDRARRISPRFD